MTRMTIGAMRTRLRAECTTRGVNPRDADLLLADLTGRSPAWVMAHDDEPIDAAAIEALMERRFAGEPLQYIRGRADFFGHEFFVDDRVLIPRPETELLVEQAIARAPRGGRVIDVGTGSGCIAASIARARPDLHVFAVDVSAGALAVAKKNGVTRLAASDLLTSIRGTFDLIVSNPPYIPAVDVESLATEVRDHEPRQALTPGPRGTEAIARIYAQAHGAAVMLEIGFGQATAVRGIAEHAGYRIETIIPDLAGIPRVVVSSAS